MTTFSFRKTAQRCIVCITQSNWVKIWFSCFSVLSGSAEVQVIWGDTVRRLLIACFIGNISAQKYQNPFMCVKVITNQRWNVFWDTVYNSAQWHARIYEKFLNPVYTIQPVVKPRCTTGLTTDCIHDTTGCQTSLTTCLTTGCIV